MQKWMLFSKISAKYWVNHKKRLLTFALIVILGTAALISSSLLIRSEKQAVLDEELRLLGDYDIIMYDISDKDGVDFSQNNAVKKFGKYYELGTAVTDNGAETYAACFDSEDSENLYHMTCTRGRYPQNSNEIALDLNTAKSLGIKPYPDETVSLQLVSSSGKAIEKKTYTVSGIYELSSPITYGGWYRYPSMMDLGEANMPGVFFHSSINDIVKSDTITWFLQTDESDLNALCNEFITNSDSIDMTQIDTPEGRRFAYSYVLGIAETIENKYGDSSISSIFSAIKNGDGIKDFYSGVLMPVFMVLIAFVVIISIMGITRNILKDKQEGFAVLRSIGMQRSSLFIMIMLDFLVLSVVFILLGTAVGIGLHMTMLKLLNSIFGIRLGYGFNSDVTVKAVTYDPFVLSAATVFVCIIIAVVISSVKFLRLTPIRLFDKSNRKSKNAKHSSSSKPKSWRSVLSRKIDLYDHSAAFICVIIMSAALFGYTYFHALSDLNNKELEYQKTEYQLNNWDYKAEKNNQLLMYDFNIENHHDYGIDVSCYDDIVKQDFVDDCSARIINKSTRLSYQPNEISDEELSQLSDLSLRRYSNIDETSDFETALQSAENAMIEKIGYSDDEVILSAPTIGLPDKVLQDLNARVCDGKIDIDKLDSGDEVILAMDKDEYEKYKAFFKAGDKLPLSDIILSDEEDKLDFGSLMPSEISKPVFSQMVTTPEGDDVELTSYAFGKRHDIDTTIGAIVLLEDDEIMRYMTLAGQESYGMNIFCTFKEFGAWGLNDAKLTELDIKLTKSADIEAVDNYWYELLSGSEGVTVRSTAEITAQMNTGIRKTMSVYYCMVIILIVLALITTAIIIYSDVRMRSTKFAVMRACGMSVRQIAYLIIKQNMVYPIIGAFLSIVPVALCQRYFDYIAKMVDTEKWNYTQFEGIPWYHYVPFRYKLYDYNMPAVMAVCFAVYVVIMLIVTVPQIHFISKQSISENIEKSDF